MDISRLHPDTVDLWFSYLQAEKDRVRGEFMPALDRFIESLVRHDEPTWHEWAIGLAREIVDRKREIPVRFPLFRQVLLPALSKGVLDERQGCARWLAHFDNLLAKCNATGLPDSLNSSFALLQEAMRVNPDDRTARVMFVQRTANYFDYTLHELPAGVLYGHDGTSLAECDDLIAALEEFCDHVRLLGEEEQYSELIADCTLHYHAYRAYLSLHRPGGSYASYLDQR